MDSAIVALRALTDAGRPIHLIAGGQGKGQDFSPLREPVATSCVGVYLIGQDAGIIATALEGLDVPVTQCGELDVALDRACTAARQAIASARWVSAARHGPRAAGVSQDPEQVVLLAPGCASFDQFADFEARGDLFRELVAQI